MPHTALTAFLIAAMTQELAHAACRTWLRHVFLQAIEQPDQQLYDEQARTVTYTRSLRHHSLLLIVLPAHPYMAKYLAWLDKQRRPSSDRERREMIPMEEWDARQGLSTQTIFTHIREHGRPPMDRLSLSMPM